MKMPCPLLINSQSDTWSRLLIQIHILNDKQCRSRSVGFFRCQLIWISTVCKGRIYPGSAGQGLRLMIWSGQVYELVWDEKWLRSACRLWRYNWSKVLTDDWETDGWQTTILSATLEPSAKWAKTNQNNMTPSPLVAAHNNKFSH